MKHIFFVYFFLLTGIVFAQRTTVTLNNDWQYGAGNDANNITRWEKVDLPHTWNVSDVMDDTPGYYRGVSWYRKKLVVDKAFRGKEIYLRFEGANQEATVFINGKKAGDHTGGYTAFSIPVTSLLKWNGDNELLVKVDNSANRNIPPLSADFTFYGGIYREVSLIAVEPVHFSLSDYGSKAVFITTPMVNSKKATVTVKGTISNKEAAQKKIKISTVIYNKAGKKIAETTTATAINAGTDQPIEQVIKTITQPHLWSADDPYLYKVVTRIIDIKTGKALDEVSTPLGFRWFKFDAAKGFFLNDRSVKLVGTSRHQDYKGMGNAVPSKLAIRDVELIKEMGGNFLRVAHYPQDPAVLEACDRLGILASVEISIVNEITESDSFYHNCEQMQVEMIRQNFNHPSVIMWCYMNEVLLRSPSFNNDKERQKKYNSSITQLAKRLDSITRKEDPSRYTMIAHHGDFNRYRDIGLIDIPMIVGWNLYSGWYGATIEDFPIFLDKFHKAYPDKPMMVTEYGADADPRIRSDAPVRFDKSVEYTTTFHQYYLKEMMKRPFVAAAMIWNLADFNSETRTESMPHINNKGLLEWDRTPKDPYYYYKAILQKAPFVKILGSPLRGSIADSGMTVSDQTLQVAGNVKEITLIVNGKVQERKVTDNGIAEWKVALVNGINTIEARAQQNGKSYSDKVPVECRIIPYHLSNKDIPFNEMNILMGAGRYFIDSDNELWMPDQPYNEGSWGYVGGKPFKLPGNTRLPYGTDRNINGTDDDPIYQTQQSGIESYRLDVGAGEYEITLHFAELLDGKVKELDYNPAATGRTEPSGQRVFNVSVNDSLVLENFNITEQYGTAAAVAKTIKIDVRGNRGIEIVFRAIDGEPVLNALQVKRIGTKRDERVFITK